MGRVAQQGSGGREYFLGDALNSARQLVNHAGRVGLGRTYQPFGDLLSIAGEIQTAYGFTGEWTDATGLVNLRDRYYRPTTGRFVQPDPFEGFPTRPISLNAYPYAYDNPLIYTDASGRNPVLALIAGIAGGILFGAAAGATFGGLTYEWARGGKCGCDMQQRALSMTEWEWIGANALAGGILGGAAVVAGLVASLAPGALILVSGLGLVVSVDEFVHTVEIMLNETGLTLCTGMLLMIATVGIVLSTIGIVAGVRGWQASGSLLAWESVAPRVIRFSDGGQVNKVYSQHASDWGLYDNWNPENGKILEQILVEHVQNPDVLQIVGTYRQQPAIHYVDPRTRLNVFTHPNGDLWSGYQLSDSQLLRLLTTGDLGGG